MSEKASTALRRKKVLQAVVIEHVRTFAPVSSKVVATKHVPEVSSATIRNDMALMEREGLIVQPHTSAGRVPTESGYRAFVDSLGPVLTLDGERGEQIRMDLEQAADLDDAIDRAVRLLARVARQTAVVEYPDLSAMVLHRVELVPLPNGSLLLLLIAASGRVLERHMDLTHQVEPLSEAEVEQLRNVLNALLAGQSATVVKERLENLDREIPPNLTYLAAVLREIIVEVLHTLAPTRIVTAGTAHLARLGAGLLDVAEIFELLEEQATLSELFDLSGEDAVQVTIGKEHKFESLEQTSLVSSTYAGPSPRTRHLGVIGPTRMDYERSLAAVETVGRYLSALLLEQFGQGASS